MGDRPRLLRLTRPVSAPPGSQSPGATFRGHLVFRGEGGVVGAVDGGTLLGQFAVAHWDVDRNQISVALDEDLHQLDLGPDDQFGSRADEHGVGEAVARRVVLREAVEAVQVDLEQGPVQRRADDRAALDEGGDVLLLLFLEVRAGQHLLEDRVDRAVRVDVACDLGQLHAILEASCEEDLDLLGVRGGDRRRDVRLQSIGNGRRDRPRLALHGDAAGSR